MFDAVATRSSHHPIIFYGIWGPRSGSGASLWEHFSLESNHNATPAWNPKGPMRASASQLAWIMMSYDMQTAEAVTVAEAVTTGDLNWPWRQPIMFAPIHCKMRMKHTNACSYMTRMKHTKSAALAIQSALWIMMSYNFLQHFEINGVVFCQGKT